MTISSTNANSDTDPKMVIEKKKGSVVYFTISNFLSKPITLTDLKFNINLNLDASTDPTDPQNIVGFQKRITLEEVKITNKNESIEIWDNDNVLIIPENSTQSFKFKFSIAKEMLDYTSTYTYSFSGAYISPSTGNLELLLSDLRIETNY